MGPKPSQYQVVESIMPSDMAQWVITKVSLPLRPVLAAPRAFGRLEIQGVAFSPAGQQCLRIFVTDYLMQPTKSILDLPDAIRRSIGPFL
jgi:hypothetical protein